MRKVCALRGSSATADRSLERPKKHKTFTFFRKGKTKNDLLLPQQKVVLTRLKQSRDR